jgi:uncharacterized membrane protein
MLCHALVVGVEDLMAENHTRSIAKAVSWRVTGTIDTFVIAWLITGRAATAGGIAATEVFTKLVLFYLHERGWNLIHWGRPALEEQVSKVGTAS